MSEMILNQILTELKEIKHQQVETNKRIETMNKRIDKVSEHDKEIYKIKKIFKTNLFDCHSFYDSKVNNELRAIYMFVV